MVHTLSRKIGSSPSRANTFDLGMFSHLSKTARSEQVSQKGIGLNLSTVLSTTNSHWNYFQANTGSSRLTATHCTSWPAPLGLFCRPPSGKDSWVFQPGGLLTPSGAGGSKWRSEWWCCLQPLKMHDFAILHRLAKWFTLRQLAHNFLVDSNSFCLSKALSPKLKYLSKLCMPLQNRQERNALEPWATGLRAG